MYFVSTFHGSAIHRTRARAPAHNASLRAILQHVSTAAPAHLPRCPPHPSTFYLADRATFPAFTFLPFHPRGIPRFPAVPLSRTSP